VVAANILALECSYSGALNIGTARETDVIALLAALQDKAGSRVSAIHGPPKAGEQRRSSLEASRARAELGWTPQTSLEEGLEKTIAYYRQGKIG